MYRMRHVFLSLVHVSSLCQHRLAYILYEPWYIRRVTMIYILHIYMYTTATQCNLQYVYAVYVQVLLGKRPPAQVAEGNHHKCRWSVCTSCWNEKHHQCKLLKVRGTGHQHPLAHVGAGCSNNATCTWAQLQSM